MLAVEVIVYLNQYHTSYDGESSHHVEIRAIGLGYLTDNPERFIEKVVDVTCYSIYLICLYNVPEQITL